MGRKPQALGLSKHSADSISLSMKFIVIQTMCRGQVRGSYWRTCTLYTKATSKLINILLANKNYWKTPTIYTTCWRAGIAWLASHADILLAFQAILCNT